MPVFELESGRGDDRFVSRSLERWLESQEGRSWSVHEVGLDGFKDEVERRSALLCTSCHDRPDAFAPNATSFTACALRHQPVDHDESNRLFGKVVRRVDARSRYELKVGLTVLSKPLREVLCFLRAGDILQRHGHDLLALPLELSAKHLRRIGFAGVKYLEELTHAPQKPLPVRHGSRSAQRREVADVPDEVCKAKLHQDISVLHELAVCREVVAADDSIELAAEHFKEHIRPTRARNLEEGECFCSKAPGPEPLLVLLVPSLIDVEPVLQRQPLQELVVCGLQSVADLLYHLSELPTRDGESENVAQVLPDGGEARMTASFEVCNYCGQCQ